MAAMTLSTRRPALLLFLGSGLLLAGALGFQYLGGLAPCPLCIDQRVAHGIVLVLAAVAVLAGDRSPALAGVAAITAVVALASGAAVAGYHVGLEQDLWQGPPSCAAEPVRAATSKEWLEEMLKRTTVVRCDEVAWSLFGISMAGYNMLISLGLVAVTVRMLAREDR